MYWWAIAASQRDVTRFGFITTNSISQAFNRSVIDAATSLKLIYAVANHPWVDGADGADVRIAITVAGQASSSAIPKLDTVELERPMPEGYGEREIMMNSRTGDRISANLTIGVDVNATAALNSNRGLSCPGVQLSGQGFILTADEVGKFSPTSRNIVRRYLTGWELNNRPKMRFVIDTFGLDEKYLQVTFPDIYQHLLVNVRPERQQNPRPKYAREWWLHAEPRSKFKKSFAGLSRMCVTSRTSKHRVFEFRTMDVLPETKVLVISLDDAYHLGVLNSRAHVFFSTVAGARLGVGDDPTYNHSECFDPFPFPADVPEPLKDSIRGEAEALDALRKRVLAGHEDLTLTKLYNVLEALREGGALTDAERTIHDRGLVTLIRQHHDTIDALVAEAYGWPADLSDEDILTRLVALNKERAAEEAKGLIRWLRPEYQAPDYAAPLTQTLDLGEAAPVLSDKIVPWPGTLPEQVSAVQQILAVSPAPLAAGDIARAFKGKRAATVRPVLDALAGIGMARRLKDRRYAA